MNPHAGNRILIVDDVPGNVGLLFDFLRDAGFKVLVSESGTHALADLPAMAPDLILLDVMMPGLDGFETCRRLKADPQWRDIPVFFMTALSDPVDKVKGLELGAVDYVTKPIFPAEVLARIAAHLQIRALQQALQAQNDLLEEKNERLDHAVQQRIAAERALQQSLDRAVMVIDGAGRLLFITRPGERLLRLFFPGNDGATLPAEFSAWLARGGGAAPLAHPRGERQLAVRLAPDQQPGGCRLLIMEEKAPPPTPARLLALGLTPREAEILFWIAQSKTSPEIGLILGVATTTVKKHVENILPKLGVETRLAAALKAMEALGMHPG